MVVLMTVLIQHPNEPSIPGASILRCFHSQKRLVVLLPKWLGTTADISMKGLLTPSFIKSHIGDLIRFLLRRVGDT
jgi:hypothetical protein